MLKILFSNDEASQFSAPILEASAKVGLTPHVEWNFEEYAETTIEQAQRESFGLIITDDRKYVPGTHDRVEQELQGIEMAHQIKAILPHQKIWLFSRGWWEGSDIACFDKVIKISRPQDLELPILFYNIIGFINTELKFKAKILNLKGTRKLTDHILYDSLSRYALTEREWQDFCSTFTQLIDSLPETRRRVIELRYDLYCESAKYGASLTRDGLLPHRVIGEVLGAVRTPPKPYATASVSQMERDAFNAMRRKCRLLINALPKRELVFDDFQLNYKSLYSPQAIPVNRQRSMYLDMEIAELDLSVRVANCLDVANIKTVRQLIAKSEQEVLRYRIGRRGLNEIKKVLAEMGLSLGMIL